MKGKLLTLEEVQALPNGTKVILESNNLKPHLCYKQGLNLVREKDRSCVDITTSGWDFFKRKTYLYEEELEVKEYLTWEIWRDVEKLEGKVFKLVSEYKGIGKEFGTGDLVKVTKYHSIYGLGSVKYSNIRITDLTGFEVWTLAQLPVTFLEAICSNKDFKIEHELIISRLNPKTHYGDEYANECVKSLLDNSYVDSSKLLILLGWTFNVSEIAKIVIESKCYLKD